METSLLPQRLSDRNVLYIRLTLSMVTLAKSLAGVRLDQLGRSGEETTLLDALSCPTHSVGVLKPCQRYLTSPSGLAGTI